MAESMLATVKLAEIFALVPNYSISKKTFSRNIPQSLIMMAIFAFLYAGSMYVKVVYTEDKSMTFYLNVITMSILNLTNIYIVFTALVDYKLFQKLFNGITEVDRMLLGEFSVKTQKPRLTTIKCIVIQLIASSLILLGISNCFDDEGIFDWKQLTSAQDALQNSCLTMFVLVKFFLLEIFLGQIDAINLILEKFDDVREKDFVVATVDPKDDPLLIVQVKIYNLVDLFNDMFGVHMFLMIIFTVFTILLTIAIGMDSNAATITLSSILVWCFYLIIQGIAVATMCEKVANEGKRTITVAYKALQKHAKVPALREKFFILAQQATARCPQFTAAGFFNVNFSMLFTFVNLITTYVIVIIQFSSPE